MPALNVREAYDALEQYGKTYGRVPLLLLLHGAVPQSFRADMLNLIKLNFLAHEAGTDLTVDADVLFSPLVESAAEGYYRLDPEVRRHCLALLDAAYRYESERRSVEVARFVLAYADEMERRAEVTLDPLLAEYLTIQRWVALAFIEPARAAEEFARALERSEAESDAVVRARLGTMTAALSIPLEGHDFLLAYARGLDAISRGDEELAGRLFTSLGGEEIRVGEVVLQTARPGIEQRAGAEAKPEAVPTRPRVYISYGVEDTPQAVRIEQTLQNAGAEIFRVADIFRPWDERLADEMRRSDYFVAVISAAVLRTERRGIFREWQLAAKEQRLRPANSQYFIPVIVDDTPPSDLPDVMRSLNAVRAPGGKLPENVIATILGTVRSPDAPTAQQTEAPSLVPRKTRAAVRSFLEDPSRSVLLIRGTDPRAVDAVVQFVREAVQAQTRTWVAIDLGYGPAYWRPEDIVRTFADQAGLFIDPVARPEDPQNIRRLAVSLLDALRPRRACVLLRGFELLHLPWQVLDFISELVDSAHRTPFVTFVLVNFEETLGIPARFLAERIDVQPVSRADVIEYLRVAFAQRGQRASAAVLESAADAVFRSVDPKAGYAEFQKALERAVRLLFENA